VWQVLAWTQEGNDVRLGDWTAREIEVLNSWQLLTAKPVVYLVNMSAKVRVQRSRHRIANSKANTS
jgi:ribosome-binding ATPase YchF (GTP1/OBG family)